jgi:menaquinone-dependent protoporphyrinogen IX oxidase
MRFAIVYDSRTGTTKSAAEKMTELVISKGHECDLVPVQAADSAAVSAADAVCIGSWTEGLFFILQHATKATTEFVSTLSLDGKPAAVFCTYKTSAGKMLPKMAAAMTARGANVTGQLKARGPVVPPGFESWVDSTG